MRPICRIIDFRDEFQRKRIRQEDYNYKNQLSKAFENNRRLNLPIPDFKLGNTSFSSLENHSNFQEVIHDGIYSLHPGRIGFNCFNIAIKAQGILKETLSIDSLLTLGSYSEVEEKEKKFYESFTKLKYRYNHPDYKTVKINLHAWLTLEDYFIIDPSILTSLKMRGYHKEIDYRNFYFLDSLNQDHPSIPYKYHPILVGDKYLQKLDLLNPI